MLDLAKMLHAQYDPTQPENVPEDPLAQLRADLAECKAQLKEAHATIALQSRTIAALNGGSHPQVTALHLPLRKKGKRSIRTPPLNT